MTPLNASGVNGITPRDDDISPRGQSRAVYSELFSQLTNLLKLRIGVVMMLTALVAMVATPGPQPSAFEALVLAFAVLISAGAAGAFNQYFEVDLDRKVPRTCNRPFVTGYFRKGPLWLGIILLLLVAGGRVRSPGTEPTGSDLYLPRCIFLRDCVHRVAETSLLDQYCHRWCLWKLCGTRGCSRG